MSDSFIKDHIIYKRFYYKNQPSNYFISEYGDVYNIVTDHYLSQSLNCSGRKIVCLSISGESIPIPIHHLVAIVFLGKIPEGMTVDHIDEFCLNNHYSNLRFLSASDNTKNYIRNKGISKKYSDELIHSICKDLKNGIYYRKLADKYNIPILYLYYIVHYKIRKNIVDKYKPFPINAYRVKNDRKIDKELITDMINIKYSNAQIYETLQIENNNANNKLINKLRKKLGIKDPKFLDDELKESVTNLIKSGFSNNEIVSMLKLPKTNQIRDLFARTRKRLHIPDFNRNGVPSNIQTEIKELVSQGKSNKDILSIYELERTKYTINLLAKLRQTVKKTSSTTIENNDIYYTIDIKL